MSRLRVSVAGSGVLPPGDPRRRLAWELGRALVGAGHVVVCGGMGGVMDAVAQGGQSSPRHRPDSVVGLVPGTGTEGASEHLDVALPTGLGHLRNSLVARSDAVVAIGGGAGTLSELAMAWLFDRLCIAYRVEGWSGELADRRIDDRIRFEDRPDDRVYGVDRAEQVLALLDRWAAPPN